MSYVEVLFLTQCVLSSEGILDKTSVYLVVLKVHSKFVTQFLATINVYKLGELGDTNVWMLDSINVWILDISAKQTFVYQIYLWVCLEMFIVARDVPYLEFPHCVSRKVYPI